MPKKKDPDGWLDPKLKLALLDEVFTNTQRGFDELEAAYEKRREGKRAPTWAAVSSQEHARHNKLFEALLLEQPISAKHLGAIEKLTLDGDRDVYPWVFPFWWELGSHFKITDLRDLARCPALADLHLGQGLVGDCSLAPLEDLPVLRELSLCTSGDYRDIESVADLPSLTKIEVVNLAHTSTGVWNTTLDKLRARGVAVEAR